MAGSGGVRGAAPGCHGCSQLPFRQQLVFFFPIRILTKTGAKHITYLLDMKKSYEYSKAKTFLG